MIPLRLIGCGNPFASDDAAGLACVDEIAARHPEYECLSLRQAGVDLLDLLGDAGEVIFVDAVTGGGEPGAVVLCRLPCSAIETRSLAALSGHGWGIAEVIELAAALRRPIADVVGLIGIEIGSVAAGHGMTPAVSRAVARVADEVEELIAAIRRLPPGGSCVA